MSKRKVLEVILLMLTVLLTAVQSSNGLEAGSDSDNRLEQHFD